MTTEDEIRIRSEAAERRFSFWRKVCGCQAGALLLLATLAWRIPAMLRAPSWTWSALAAEAGIALLAGMIGKLAAVAGARFLLFADMALSQRRLRRIRIDAMGVGRELV